MKKIITTLQNEIFPELQNRDITREQGFRLFNSIIYAKVLGSINLSEKSTDYIINIFLRLDPLLTNLRGLFHSEPIEIAKIYDTLKKIVLNCGLSEERILSSTQQANKEKRNYIKFGSSFSNSLLIGRRVSYGTSKC